MRGLQIRPSHIFTFYSHVYIRRRLQQPSGTSGSLSHEGSINEQSAATFVPEVDHLTRRSWSSDLCFCATLRHLRHDGSGILRTEGFRVCACASGQPSVTFGLQKVIFFGPKVMVFELALLSVHPISSGMLGSISLWPCKQVREHF